MNKLSKSFIPKERPNSQKKPSEKTHSVVQVCDISFTDIQALFGKYQLKIQHIPKDQPISGSYWGDSEAGLINNTLYFRDDTPVHSVFHEACHYICMDEARRKALDTNAEGDYDEENAVCYLQILLADEVTTYSSKQMMRDMDTWGYTFRLGSAQAWFENDAEDALAWLINKQLLNSKHRPNYKLRLT